jgi:hypothetical protein
MNRHMTIPSTLLLDAAFEFAAGAGLIAFAGPLGDWLRIGAPACVALGVVFLAVGAFILWLRRAPDLSMVRALAWANIAGGCAGWAVFAAAWGALGIEGRTVLGCASDAFIAVGLLELWALRAHGAARLARG